MCKKYTFVFSFSAAVHSCAHKVSWYNPSLQQTLVTLSLHFLNLLVLVANLRAC